LLIGYPPFHAWSLGVTLAVFGISIVARIFWDVLEGIWHRIWDR